MAGTNEEGMPARGRLPEPVLVKRRARQRCRESRAPAALVRSCGPRDPRCRPGRGSRRERQRPSSAGSSARPVAEPPPRDLFVRTDVALAGLGDHLGRHRWWRRSLVPARRLCPVAHRLLVERQRRGAGPQDSAGQNRLESGVRISSQMISSPSTNPSSNLVSAITMPRSNASSAATL